MKIIKPYFEILTPLDGKEILKSIERIGRVCYKSENRIDEESAEKFIKNLLSRGHESVIEHISVTVKVICDRGVSYEIVRHRIASYSQESTRYCNYALGKFGNELTVIHPCFWNESDERYQIWLKSMQIVEQAYLDLISQGASPQEARSVLPNSLKTEIVMTMNLREWRHFFRLRADSHAHPQMQEIATLMLTEFHRQIPVLFEDLWIEKKEQFGDNLVK